MSLLMLTVIGATIGCGQQKQSDMTETSEEKKTEAESVSENIMNPIEQSRCWRCGWEKCR